MDRVLSPMLLEQVMEDSAKELQSWSNAFTCDLCLQPELFKGQRSSRFTTLKTYRLGSYICSLYLQDCQVSHMGRETPTFWAFLPLSHLGNWVSHTEQKKSFQTSFLLKRNGPNDLNKMISKVYGCKMGQGEWQIFS